MTDDARTRAWGVPLAMLLATGTAYVTADFRDAWLGAEQWRGLFLFFTLISAGWLLVEVLADRVAARLHVDPPPRRGRRK